MDELAGVFGKLRWSRHDIQSQRNCRCGAGGWPGLSVYTGDGRGILRYCNVPRRLLRVGLEQLELVLRFMRCRCRRAHTKRGSAADEWRATLWAHLRVLPVYRAVLSHRLCSDSMDVVADLLEPLLRYDKLPPQRLESPLFSVWLLAQAFRQSWGCE